MEIQEINAHEKVKVKDAELIALSSALMNRVSPYLTKFVSEIVFKIDNENEYYWFGYNSATNKVFVAFSNKFLNYLIHKHNLQDKDPLIAANLVAKLMDEELLNTFAQFIEHELDHAQLTQMQEKDAVLSEAESSFINSVLSNARRKEILLLLGFRQAGDDILFPEGFIDENWYDIIKYNHQQIFIGSLYMEDPQLRRRYLLQSYYAGLQEQYLMILSKLSPLQRDDELVLTSYCISTGYLLPYSSTGFLNSFFGKTKAQIIAEAHKILEQMNPQHFERFIDALQEESLGWTNIAIQRTLRNWGDDVQEN